MNRARAASEDGISVHLRRRYFLIGKRRFQILAHEPGERSDSRIFASGEREE